ncbi:hypothetical protein DFJ77DRAFT_64104 [Powellomyces hirtus]|nr:hypothetical protein DFJ77DRAFT_64104 [Powellomyces hirtus]
MAPRCKISTLVASKCCFAALERTLRREACYSCASAMKKLEHLSVMTTHGTNLVALHFGGDGGEREDDPMDMRASRDRIGVISMVFVAVSWEWKILRTVNLPESNVMANLATPRHRAVRHALSDNARRARFPSPSPSGPPTDTMSKATSSKGTEKSRAKTQILKILWGNYKLQNTGRATTTKSGTLCHSPGAHFKIPSQYLIKALNIKSRFLQCAAYEKVPM